MSVSVCGDDCFAITLSSAKWGKSFMIEKFRELMQDYPL